MTGLGGTPPAGGVATTVAAQDVEARYGLERDKMSLGLLGKLFGVSAQAPTNIAGLVVTVFTLACVLPLFVPTSVTFVEYLKIVLPVITLGLGYLFGKRK